MKDGVFCVCRYFYIFSFVDVLSVVFMSVEANHAGDCLVWGFVFFVVLLLCRMKPTLR
jgi:hypothetical protein